MLFKFLVKKVFYLVLNKAGFQSKNRLQQKKCYK